MVMAKKDIPTKNNTVLLGDKVKASSGIVGTSNKKFYSSSNIPSRGIAAGIGGIGSNRNSPSRPRTKTCRDRYGRTFIC